MKPETKLKIVLNQLAKLTLEYKKTQIVLARAAARVGEKHEQLVSICPHKETKTKTQYIEGGYLDRLEIIHKDVCVLCGKELHRRTETGYYS